MKRGSERAKEGDLEAGNAGFGARFGGEQLVLTLDLEEALVLAGEQSDERSERAGGGAPERNERGRGHAGAERARRN
jgi:hypothetical protein